MLRRLTKWASINPLKTVNLLEIRQYRAKLEKIQNCLSYLERVTTIPKGSTSKQGEAVDADNSVKR